MTSIQETALPTDAPAQPEPTAASQFRALLKAFWAGEGRTGILLLAIAIVAVIVATAFGQVRLNAWNQPFYNAVARKDVAAFLDQVVVFGMIVSVLLVLNVAQGWLQQMMKLKLREWLTRDLIGQWLQQRRAFRISRVGEIGTNPDQRIHQDGQRLTELCADLGIGLFQSGLLLASFIGVLWVLSSGIVLTINGQDYTIPGYMVWCALLYAATGSWISWLVGRPLVVLNASRYAREAEFRSALVRTREHADGIAFYGDESREKQGLLAEFGTVLLAMRKIVTAAVRPDLGHRRLWLARHRRADCRRLAGLFRRQALLRRADGGCRGLLPGTAGSPLVRRQCRDDCRLAGDAPPCDGLPRGAH